MHNSPQIFAHRGAKSVAPENTLPAFDAALSMGVDGIELDVQCTADGELAIIHDFHVDGTTDGSGLVSSFTAAELGGLDAGSHFAPEFAGIGVPMLPHVLDLIGNHCRLNIEIKSQDVMLGGDEVEQVLAIIEQRKLYDQVIVSSFNPVTLIKLRWLNKRVDIGVLHGPELPPYLREAWSSAMVQPQAFHPQYTGVDQDFVAWAKAANLAVNTWTVNEADEARRLADLGMDTIISDVPDQLMAVLRS